VLKFPKVFDTLLSIPILAGCFGPQKGFRGHTRYSGFGFEDGKRDEFNLEAIDVR
jgi:hypothetical protein